MNKTSIVDRGIPFVHAHHPRAALRRHQRFHTVALGIVFLLLGVL
jgi:hypothetical protein